MAVWLLIVGILTLSQIQGFGVGSCRGKCAQKSTDCYCDGFCKANKDCCGDFESQCDGDLLRCEDSPECLLLNGGPVQCSALTKLAGFCKDAALTKLTRCCGKTCGLCSAVQGATTLRTVAANSGLTIEQDDYVDTSQQYCAHGCSGHGSCNKATGACSCLNGWGSSTDISQYKAADCSQRVCPSGVVWGGHNPAASSSQYAECSGRGTCDRVSGECRCAAAFTGAACDRSRCFNDCSGHGKCVDMQGVAQDQAVAPLGSRVDYVDGAVNNAQDVIWDATRIYGCVCESSWAVGLGEGDTQSAEYFGPDCSLRRCPSGDDPTTNTTDETDCTGVNGGLLGNLCHVDCANRGTCDHQTGTCSCSDGYTGTNCDSKIEYF